MYISLSKVKNMFDVTYDTADGDGSSTIAANLVSGTLIREEHLALEK